MPSNNSLLGLTCLVLLFITLQDKTKALDPQNIVFVIISQPEPYHASVARRLKDNIEEQMLALKNEPSAVFLTHEDLPVPGAWTIVPLLEPLVTRLKGGDVRWVLFVEAHTAVFCHNLVKALEAADTQEDVSWIGYPLRDEEPTIIHHFTYDETLEEEDGFMYPHFASGFAMKFQLIQRLNNLIKKGKRNVENFSIDPAYELAMLVRGDPNDPGPLLTPDLSFCVVSGDNCATYPRHFDICGRPVREDTVYFAVKTWSGFHSTRARVVKKTWGKHVTHLMFFSDEADPSLPSIDLGVPNTKRGHCAKTIAILKYLKEKLKDMPQIKWVFLADDDTILGVQRLCEVLSCYRGGDDVTILGERYGYGYGKKESSRKGYDYITSGGGIALSVQAASILSTCACAAIDAPDDMALGACARDRDISLTHTPLMHQARPQDYPREILARDRPISFHRHSSPEPAKTYATWFQHDDLALKKVHTEL